MYSETSLQVSVNLLNLLTYILNLLTYLRVKAIVFTSVTSNFSTCFRTILSQVIHKIQNAMCKHVA